MESANIQSVVTYTDSLVWFQDSIGYYTDLGTLSIVTPPVVHNGIVQVYLRNDSISDRWYNLPWSIPYSGTFIIYNYSYSLDGVRIGVFRLDGIPIDNPGIKAFKLVTTSL